MKQIKKSVGHALQGIKEIYKKERNFRIHIGITLIAVVIGCVMDWAPWKWGLFILAAVIVLSLEAVNSAIEYSWNHLEPNHHPVVGIIKDVMAGAVLIASIGAVLIGCILVFL